MSFLGDLVNSIGSDKASAPQVKPFKRQTAVSTVATSKPAANLSQSSTSTSPPPNILKRKADEHDPRPIDRTLKLSTLSTVQTKDNSRPAIPTLNGSKPAPPKPTSLPPTPSTAGSMKQPPKGSYADIMARAKQAQEQRSTSKVGMIKHQATNKEKTSKVAERRREEQERAKTEKARSNERSASHDRKNKKRSNSPLKKDDKLRPRKAARPPLNAPSGYKGTLGTASKRNAGTAAGGASKRSKYDEYLGTDEEDDSEMGDIDEGYDYGSDQSSDMEAGWDELEDEEASALQAARHDDARELAIEHRLKAEKEDRRKKLAAMAKKNR